MRNAMVRTVVLGATLIGAHVLAATGPAVRCGAAKVRAVAGATAAKLRCHADEVLRGSTSAAACLERAQTRLADAFARAQSKGGCASSLGAARLGFALDSWVAGAVATFAPPALPPLGPPTEASLRCARSKVRSVSRAFVGKLRCRAAAVRRAASDVACDRRVQDALADAFARVDARGGCTASVDAAAFGAATGAFVASTVAAVTAPAATPTPAPSMTPAPTGSPAPSADGWACCEVNHPELGSCNGGVTGPSGSPLADAFRSFCEGQSGTWTPLRCASAQCGAAVTCCSVGGGAIGTSEYFGSPDPAAIAQLCAINGGTLLPGACPP